MPDDRPREEENRGESDGEVISGRGQRAEGRGQRAERSHWPKTSKPPELRVCSRAEFHSRARPLDVNHDVRFILIYVYPYMYSTVPSAALRTSAEPPLQIYPQMPFSFTYTFIHICVFLTRCAQSLNTLRSTHHGPTTARTSKQIRAFSPLNRLHSVATAAL